MEEILQWKGYLKRWKIKVANLWDMVYVLANFADGFVAHQLARREETAEWNTIW